VTHVIRLQDVINPYIFCWNNSQN